MRTEIDLKECEQSVYSRSEIDLSESDIDLNVSYSVYKVFMHACTSILDRSELERSYYVSGLIVTSSVHERNFQLGTSHLNYQLTSEPQALGVYFRIKTSNGIILATIHLAYETAPIMYLVFSPIMCINVSYIDKWRTNTSHLRSEKQLYKQLYKPTQPELLDLRIRTECSEYVDLFFDAYWAYVRKKKPQHWKSAFRTCSIRYIIQVHLRVTL